MVIDVSEAVLWNVSSYMSVDTS